MTRLVLLAGTMLLLYLPDAFTPVVSCSYDSIPGLYDIASFASSQVQTRERTTGYSAMEALDLVKNRYASTFVKVDSGQAEDSYYYKLPEAELYLVYEGMDQAGERYLIHLYEFITEDTATGMGHSYTYGWYGVEPGTGTVIDLAN